MNMVLFNLMQPPAHFSIAAMLASPQSTRAVVMVRKSRADTGEIVGTWNRNWQEVAVDAHALATESVRQGVRLPSWALNTGRKCNGMLRGFNGHAGTFLVQLKSEIITDQSDYSGSVTLGGFTYSGVPIMVEEEVSVEGEEESEDDDSSHDGSDLVDTDEE